MGLSPAATRSKSRRRLYASSQTDSRSSRRPGKMPRNGELDGNGFKACSICMIGPPSWLRVGSELLGYRNFHPFTLLRSTCRRNQLPQKHRVFVLHGQLKVAANATSPSGHLLARHRILGGPVIFFPVNADTS